MTPGNPPPLSGSPVQPGRIETLVDAPIAGGEYVLYWMQKAQRADFNPALETAAFLANELRQALVVLFVLTEYPGAQAGHYHFMMEGLEETAREIRARGAGIAIRAGNPVTIVSEAARVASVLVGDAPRLATERLWRREVVGILRDRSGAGVGPGTACPYYQVETEAVVPPFLASTKEEWSARTLRVKLLPHIPDFLVASPFADWHVGGMGQRLADKLLPLPRNESQVGLPRNFSAAKLQAYPGERSAEQRLDIRSGHAAALARLDTFIENDGLSRYGSMRNDPSRNEQSGLSPWLHFGQISPVEIALRVLESEVGEAQRTSLRGVSSAANPFGSAGYPAGASAFLEQLIVRRELAVNFALFNADCARYESAVPEWAQKTLASAADERPDRFSRAELEAAATDDPYWNAAQNQMVLTGYMHNYMRMYWGKRLLAWRKDPAEAFATLVDLNDRYSLDGRDPNGYAGIAWCFGKHDMPWPSRNLFGTVRSMVPAGLERKFDMDSYTSSISLLYSVRKQEAQCSIP